MQCSSAATHIVHSNSLTADGVAGAASVELESDPSVDPPYDSPAESAAVAVWRAANPPDENDWEATTPEFFPPHPFQRHCKVPPSVTVRERHPLSFDIELRDVLHRPVRSAFSQASLFAVLIEGSEESTQRVRWRCYPTPSRVPGSSVHHVRCPTLPVPGSYQIRTRLVAINATKAQCEHNASPLFCKYNLECKQGQHIEDKQTNMHTHSTTVERRKRSNCCALFLNRVLSCSFFVPCLVFACFALFLSLSQVMRPIGPVGLLRCARVARIISSLFIRVRIYSLLLHCSRREHRSTTPLQTPLSLPPLPWRTMLWLLPLSL